MDQRFTEVLSQSDVQEVFEIVSEITCAKRPPPSGTLFERRLEKLSEFIMSHAMVGFFTMMILAGLTYFLPSDPLAFTAVWIGLLSILCVYILFVLIIVSAIPLI